MGGPDLEGEGRPQEPLSTALGPALPPAAAAALAAAAAPLAVRPKAQVDPPVGGAHGGPEDGVGHGVAAAGYQGRPVPGGEEAVEPVVAGEAAGQGVGPRGALHEGAHRLKVAAALWGAVHEGTHTCTRARAHARQ